MDALNEGNLLILEELELVKLNDHVAFKLIPKSLNLFLFVRIVLNVVLFLQKLIKLV